MKTFFTLSILLFLVVPGELRAEEPMAVLKRPVTEVIEVLTDPQYQKTGRIDEQRQEIWEITQSIFDFELIAKRAAGRYHWKNSFTSEQRREFVDLFARFLANVYLARISGNYEEIEVEFVDQQVDESGKRAQVKTVVSRQDTATPVEYSMWRRENGWKVYDVFVENVSLVQNYQTQFRSLLDKESGAELIERLRKRIEEQKNDGANTSG